MDMANTRSGDFPGRNDRKHSCCRGLGSDEVPPLFIFDISFRLGIRRHDGITIRDAAEMDIGRMADD